MTIFGPMKTGWDVEEAVEATLREWSLTYLAEVERRTLDENDEPIPPQSLQPIRSYKRDNEFRKWPEEQFPACVIISPGLAEAPVKEGNGQYRGIFTLGVAVATKGRKRPNVRKTSQLYAAAVRNAIIQHQDLGGFARGVEWVDENYNDTPIEDNRTLGAASVYFRVDVPELVTAFAGPVVPPEDPYDVPTSWPTVKEGGATVSTQRITEV